MKIDQGEMKCAIRGTNTLFDDGLQGDSYLNRRTGQIEFVAESEEAAENWSGPRAGRDRRELLGIILKSPNDWVKIPKRAVNDDSDEAFIEGFLAGVGIAQAVCA